MPDIVLLAKANYMDELRVRVGLRRANAHGRPHGHGDGEGMGPLCNSPLTDQCHTPFLAVREAEQ